MTENNNDETDDMNEMMTAMMAWMNATDAQLKYLQQVVDHLTDEVCEEAECAGSDAERLRDNIRAARAELLSTMLEEADGLGMDVAGLLSGLSSALPADEEFSNSDWPGVVVHKEGHGWCVCDVDDERYSFSIGIDPRKFGFTDGEVEALWQAISQVTEDWPEEKCSSKDDFLDAMSQGQDDPSDEDTVVLDDETEFDSSFGEEWS